MSITELKIEQYEKAILKLAFNNLRQDISRQEDINASDKDTYRTQIQALIIKIGW